MTAPPRSWRRRSADRPVPIRCQFSLRSRAKPLIRLLAGAESNMSFNYVVGPAGVDSMVSWLSGDWGKACVALTLMPRLTGVLALKVGPMFDEWHTRALVTAATSLRPVFVVFVGLCLVPMLTGCIFTSTRPELAPDIPPKYGAGQGQSAPPSLDWW